MGHTKRWISANNGRANIKGVCRRIRNPFLNKKKEITYRYSYSRIICSRNIPFQP